MKKFITILVLAAVSVTAFAQRAPKSSSYKDLKKVYIPSNYVKSPNDPYSVFWAGFEGLVTPGVSQLIMKETGTGWAFIGSTVVFSTTMDITANNLVKLSQKDAAGNFFIPDEMKGKATTNLIILGGAALAQLGVSIWSCTNAVKTAKVKNQYYQNNRRGLFSTTIYPSVDLAQTGTSVTPTAGMTLSVNF